ncbi:mannose-1-phosphate guanylyltransferase [Flavobacterium sp. Root420]|uniref:mannose-1-phosphate guanylyltransferase n=1 Tax=Flavobacterium sp. Root420 TaxID=1736533 RepID=UPI0006F54F29|nr:sugar phosphate nucleotidyltransferase [Flavobacterium sp. Root420]KQW99251.1 mannose-1-phosphate guanylyltransferase [Flavobacterium sp. Root420]
MNSTNRIIHVVLTGGVGSRLWPLSRKSQPKQYLDLFEGKSLFELTLERNAAVADDVVVVGNRDNSHLTEKVMKKLAIPFTHIIEATPRNTAAAIAFAAFNAQSDDVLVVTPSDHIIEGEVQYKAALDQAIGLAKNNFLVTFGIQPLRPETGYGYIEFDGDTVVAFHEKPNLEKAISFTESGRFLWNSGLFCFKAGFFLQELKAQEPELYKYAQLVWQDNVDGLLNYELSLQIPSISVDYAVMERSKNIKVVATHFEWSDLGSFEAVYDYLMQNGHTADLNGNIVIGSDVHTAFVGLENCLLVHTPDALLVLQKKYSQDVKEVYQQLELSGSCLI